MAVLKMKKVSVVVTKENLKPVVDKLQSLSCFHVTDTDNCLKNESEKVTFEEFDNVDLDLANIDFAIRYLEKVSTKKKKSLYEKLLGSRIEGKYSGIINASKKSFDEVVGNCVSVEEKENVNINRIKEIKEELGFLNNWSSLNLTSCQLEGNLYKVAFGKIELSKYDHFLISIGGVDGCEIDEIRSNTKSVYFSIIFLKHNLEYIEKSLKEYGFEEFRFDTNFNSVKDKICSLNLELDKLLTEKKQIDNSKIELAKNINDLKLYYDYLLWKKDNHEFLKHCCFTKQTAIFHGFVSELDYALFKSSLVDITKEVSFSILDSENYPVKLKNNSFFQPFENITNLFGTVSYKEIDPTPFLAPFFVLFFGFCLSDFFYGLVVFIATWAVLRFCPVDYQQKSFIKLMLFCGISSMVMGVVFGGYMGLTSSSLPFLYNESTGMFYGQLFNPVEDLKTKIMFITYSLGVVHLLIGVILSFFNILKNGSKRDLLGPIFLILSVLISIVYYFLGDNIGFNILNFLYVFVPVFIYGFLNQENIIQVVNDKILGWLSNVLSYSRLFALALSTSVIATVFNSLAGSVFESMGFYGLPLALIIILIGHSLNLGLGVLGSFVHSARLQFVEFFGRFLEASGQKFSPFHRRSKYVFIKNK